MTVSRLQAEMGNAEFVAWQAYYARMAQAQELELKRAKGR